MARNQKTIVDLSDYPKPTDKNKQNIASLPKNNFMQIMNEQKQEQKLEALLKKTNNVLITLKTVFPFDLFPSEFVINEQEIVVNDGFFFWSSQVKTVPLENIQDVVLTLGILFAKLTLIGKDGEEILGINILKKQEAKTAWRILHGIIKGREEGVELTAINPNTLKQKTEEIGKVKGLQIT